MSKRGPVRNNNLPFYLVPIIIGMCGIVLSHQLDDPLLRIIVVLVSLAAPLSAAGNLLSRFYSQGIERFLVMLGLALLFIGALTTASGFTEDLSLLDEIPPSVASLSRYLVLGSLFVGLIALVVMLVRREEAIGEIGDRFGHLAENMNDGLLLAAPDGTIVLVNQRFLDVLGLRESDILGENSRDLAQRVGLPQDLDEISSGGPQSQVEFTWKVNGDLRYFWLSASTVRTRRGHRAGVICTVRDITEQTLLAQRLERFAQGLQKLVEDRTQQLRDSETQLRELLLSMNEGFLTVDSEFQIIFANQKVAEMLGYTEAELHRKSLYDCVDPSERTRLYELFERSEDDDAEGINHELTMLGQDGSTYSAVVSISHMEPAKENAARFSLVLTDVSRLKDMQRQLQLRAEELERANEELLMLDRAKDTFLSNVSHELRTPLSTIRGYVEMMQSGSLGELPSAMANALSVMSRNGDRLGTLIDEMIEFSRMEIRGIRLVVSLHDLEKLINEHVLSVRPQCETHNNTVEVEFDPQLRLVWSDRKRIGQVLAILFSNAIKFSPENAPIHVRTYTRGLRDAVIEVADKGIGIDERHHRRVFDKFYQVDSAMTRRFEGAGIGLSVAKSIVEAHGGRIELESALGEGSTFRIVLPDAAFTGSASPPEWQGPDERPTVLICDEDADLLDAVQNALATTGCATHTLRSGYECLRRAQETGDVVVVVGLATQDLSAVELYSRLTDLALDGVQIVRCMAAGVPDSERRLAEHDAVVLTVPFSATDVAQAVSDACLPRLEAELEVVGMEEEPVSYAPQIVVLDDDSEFCEWLTSALGRRHVVCAAQDDAETAISEHWHTLDAIVVDLDSDNGERAASLMRQRNGSGPYLVGMTCSVAAPDKGLDGVLCKPFKLTEVLDYVGRRARELQSEGITQR